MTTDRDTIFRMAREAGFETKRAEVYVEQWTVTRTLERFAHLVAEYERENCAKVAEETICDTHLPTGVRIYGARAAAAIRARGQQPDNDNPSF